MQAVHIKTPLLCPFSDLADHALADVQRCDLVTLPGKFTGNLAKPGTDIKYAVRTRRERRQGCAELAQAGCKAHSALDASVYTAGEPFNQVIEVATVTGRRVLISHTGQEL